MRILTPPTGTYTQKPQGAAQRLWKEFKGIVYGGAAGAVLVASMYAYNVNYDERVTAERQEEMLAGVGSLYEGMSDEEIRSEFGIEMTNALMANLGDAKEDGYISLPEVSSFETELRKWKVLKSVEYGE